MSVNKPAKDNMALQGKTRQAGEPRMALSNPTSW